MNKKTDHHSRHLTPIRAGGPANHDDAHDTWIEFDDRSPDHSCADFDIDVPVPFALTALGERAITADEAREGGAL